MNGKCKQTVVVTGAAGCLGHHILRLLISNDDQCCEIRALDIQKPSSLQQSYLEQELKLYESKQQQQHQQVSQSAASQSSSTSTPTTILNQQQAKAHQRQPSTTLLNNKQATKTLNWFYGDIRDINFAERCLVNADCVIHCAAKIQTSVYYADQDEEELESVNVGGTENLLRAAVRLGVAKFVHVSSFEAWLGYEMVYYATENTLPIPRCLLFGASGSTKRDAANKVKQFSNTKLQQPAKSGELFLNAVILEFPPIYGEFDNHFVTRILKTTKFFNGKLRKITNIWTRQQQVYAGNAAWATLAAKKRMQTDASISGEEFIITDDTKIDNPYNFLTPYLKCKGMKVSQGYKYPYLPMWILMTLFFAFYKLLRSVDVFGLTSDFLSPDSQTDSPSLRKRADKELFSQVEKTKNKRKLSWYHHVNPQVLTMMCVTCFFNRAKATLRLDYEPLFSPDESKRRSLEWYENHCII